MTESTVGENGTSPEVLKENFATNSNTSNTFKTDLKNNQENTEYSPKGNLQNIKKDPEYILKIENPTAEEMNLAFSINPTIALAYKEIGDIPNSVQMVLVKRNVMYIEFLWHPTKEVQMYVITEGMKVGNALGYYKLIKNASDYSSFIAHSPLIIF